MRVVAVLYLSCSTGLRVVAVLYLSCSTGLRVVAGPLTGKLTIAWFDSPFDHTSLHVAIAHLTSYRCCASTGLTQCPADCTQVLCGNKIDLLFH